MDGKYSTIIYGGEKYPIWIASATEKKCCRFIALWVEWEMGIICGELELGGEWGREGRSTWSGRKGLFYSNI
jgi:hypothetical protein